METFLVAYDLDSDRLAGTVVTTAKNLTKGTLPKRVYNLISERQVVMGNNLVITTFIVVTIIICGVLWCCLLLVTSCPDEVHRLIVEYFLLLVRGKILGLTTLQNGYKRAVRSRSMNQDVVERTSGGQRRSRWEWLGETKELVQLLLGRAMSQSLSLLSFDVLKHFLITSDLILIYQRTRRGRWGQ